MRSYRGAEEQGERIICSNHNFDTAIFLWRTCSVHEKWSNEVGCAIRLFHVCVFPTMTSASEIHFPLNFKRHRLGDEHNMFRRGRCGDLKTVRVRGGLTGMTAGGGACRLDQVLPACGWGRGFSVVCLLKLIMIVAVVKVCRRHKMYGYHKMYWYHKFDVAIFGYHEWCRYHLLTMVELCIGYCICECSSLHLN